LLNENDEPDLLLLALILTTRPGGKNDNENPR
jgi:hypothetical protein